MVRLGQFLFRFRNGLFPLVLLLAVGTMMPKYLLGNARLDAFMDALGVLVAVLGLAVRSITIGYEYIIRGGRHHKVYAESLVTGGIYAHSRNPMYLGNGLIVLGVALIFNSPAFYVVCLPLLVVAYGAIIAAEEDWLRRKFGTEFEDYCQRVPRLLPRLTGLRRSVEGMRFNWRRVVVKEYGTIFMALLGLVFMTLWDDYRIAGSAALPSTGQILVKVVPLVIVYVVVWVLKKTRRLSAEPPQEREENLDPGRGPV